MERFHPLRLPNSKTPGSESNTPLRGAASASDAVATLTDAATGTVYESSEITDNSLMMIVTNYAYNFEITGGNVLYTNRHAELINENTAKAGTDGTAVIIYQFNY